MKRLILLPLLAVTWLVSVCFTGCKENPPTPPPVTDTPVFVITASNITEASFDVSVTPKDDEMLYLCFYVEKEVYESEIGDDDTMVESYMAQLERMGAQQDMTLADVIAEIALKGESSETCGNLDAATSYYFGVVGVDEEGEVLTELIKEEITTAEVQRQDVSFTFEVDVKATTGLVKVMADKEDATFFMNVISLADFQSEFDGDAVAFVNAFRAYWGQQGYSGADLFEQLGSTGSDEMEIEGLRPGTDYVAFAVGISKNFNPNSDASQKNFTSKALAQSDVVIEIDTISVSQINLKAKISPSNDDDEYLWSVVPKSTVDEFTDDNDLMFDFVEYLKESDLVEGQLASGELEVSQDYLLPSNNYTIIAFAYNKEEGAPIGKLYKKSFTTKPVGNEDPCTMTFDFEMPENTEETFTVKTTPSLVQWYDAGVMAKAEYDALNKDGELLSTLSASFNQYCQLYVAFLGVSIEEAAQMLSSIGVNEGEYEGVPGTEYVAYAYAIDVKNGVAACDSVYTSKPFKMAGEAAGVAVASLKVDRKIEKSDIATLRFGGAKEVQSEAIRRMVKFW